MNGMALTPQRRWANAATLDKGQTQRPGQLALCKQAVEVRTHQGNLHVRHVGVGEVVHVAFGLCSDVMECDKQAGLSHEDMRTAQHMKLTVTRPACRTRMIFRGSTLKSSGVAPLQQAAPTRVR